MKVKIMLLCVLLAITGCSSQVQTTKIGVLLPLTGPFASAGEEIRAGISEVQVDGIEFVFEDTKCEASETTKAYRKITDLDNVQFIIGPACGSPQEVVATLLKDQDQLAILPSAAPKGLYEKSDGNILQIQYALESESSFVAKEMSKKYEKVIVISYLNTFSTTLAKGFAQQFDNEIVEHIVLDTNNADIVPAIIKIKESQAQAAYIADSIFFINGGIRKLQESSIAIPIYSTYVTQFDFLKGLVDGVYYPYPTNIDTKKSIGKNLAKQSAQILVLSIQECNGEFTCVEALLKTSSSFDNKGISTREIDLFQIVDQESVKVS